jgi:ATP-dependent Clp protease adapter protein ClpS
MLVHRLPTPGNSLPSIVEQPEIDALGPGTGGSWIVTVFNNDFNTYDQVMTILMLATHCNAEEAYIETWEIDHLGSSVVHHGAEEECRKAAEIISTIGIKVEVSKD